MSKYKFEKLATESLINGIRLHLDSILLFRNASYPTSFHIAVLAMEEIAKSNWIEHYYYSSLTNEGFPDAEFEQKWLKQLYIHSAKQFAFLGRETLQYSPKFVDFIQSKKLELKKQQAIYVGLKRTKNNIETKGRISLPTSIKNKDAKQLISLNNDVLREQCERNIQQGFYYGVEGKYFILNREILIFLEADWEHRSKLKGDHWFNKWREISKK